MALGRRARCRSRDRIAAGLVRRITWLSATHRVLVTLPGIGMFALLMVIHRQDFG